MRIIDSNIHINSYNTDIYIYIYIYIYDITLSIKRYYVYIKERTKLGEQNKGRIIPYLAQNLYKLIRENV